MLSLVITYYNQPHMLARQAAVWRDYPAGIEVIVVDDGSKIPASADGCSIYRVTEDIPWHQDGARNLGAHVATGEWLLLLDIDHVLSPAAAATLLRLLPVLACGFAYRPHRRLVSGAYALRPAANIWLLRREQFWRVGGYDERLCGHYGTDLEFRPRLRRIIGERERPDVVLDVYTAAEVADASTQGLSRRVVKPRTPLGPPRVLDFDWIRVQ